MTPKKRPGKALIVSLRGLLEPGYEFDEAEEHLLSLIEAEADRIAALRGLLDVEMGKGEVSTRRVSELSAEIRLLEKQVSAWSASLRPAAPATVSWQHQRAAHSRWNAS